MRTKIFVFLFLLFIIPLQTHAKSIITNSDSVLYLITKKHTKLSKSPKYEHHDTGIFLRENVKLKAIKYIQPRWDGAQRLLGFWEVIFEDEIYYISEDKIKYNKVAKQFLPVQYRDDPSIASVRLLKNKREIKLKKPVFSDHYRELAQSKDIVKYYWNVSILEFGFGTSLMSHVRIISFGIIHPGIRFGFGGAVSFGGYFKRKADANELDRDESIFFFSRRFPITVYYMPFMRQARIHEKLDQTGNPVKRSSLINPMYLFFTFSPWTDELHNPYLDIGIAWKFSRNATWRIGYVKDGWEKYNSKVNSITIHYPEMKIQSIYTSIELNLGWTWRSKESIRK